jgi:hypothetical protein
MTYSRFTQGDQGLSTRGRSPLHGGPPRRSLRRRPNTLNFLTKNADSIQLLVVGHERAQGITALVGPPGYAALQGSDCSVLICEPQNVL